MKPKIFVGSSSSAKSLDVAYAIQENLDPDAFVTIWNQGIFQLSHNTLQDLLNAINSHEFAIFIFNNDDRIVSDDTEVSKVRDNVIFETGLFMGKLGKDRVYFVKASGVKDLKLPTDLLGINYGTYNEENENLTSALGKFCHQVRKGLRKFKPLNNQLLTNVETKVIDEIRATYKFRIVNEKGDTEYLKSTKFKVLQGHVYEKKHEVFCDNLPMKLTDIQLKAWDNQGNDLSIDIVDDLPNRKIFKVCFKHSLRKGDVLEYFYSCFWKAMFPLETEYFVFKNVAEKTTFSLQLPKTWKLQQLRAEEYVYGVVADELIPKSNKYDSTEGFNIEEYTFDRNKFREATITWRRTRS